MLDKLLDSAKRIAVSSIVLGGWVALSALIAKYVFMESYISTGGEPSTERGAAALVASMMITAFILIQIAVGALMSSKGE